MSSTDKLNAFLTMGVMSPPSVATATEISTPLTIRVSPTEGSYTALSSGTSFRASADARIIKSFTDALMPCSEIA